MGQKDYPAQSLNVDLFLVLNDVVTSEGVSES